MAWLCTRAQYQPLTLHQGVVIASFHHHPLVHQHDQIGGPHGGEPVGDEEHGSPAGSFKQVEANLAFGGGIKGTGGLIEDQHPRVLQHSPSQGHALALATGEAGAPLAHREL